MNTGSLTPDGCLTFWTVGEFTSLSLLRAGLVKAGYEEFVPEPRTPAAACRDALGEVFPGRDYLVHPLKDKDGFEVVAVCRGELKNDYQHVMTAKVEELRDPVTMQPSVRLRFSPLDDTAKAVLNAYNKHVGLIRAASVTEALTGVLGKLNGTRLRPKGAIYWLPAASLPKWAAVEEAVRFSAGSGGCNNVYLFRHTFDPDSLRGVHDAIVNEILADANAVYEEITGGELGEKALANRKHDLGDMRRKIAQYEQILGSSLDGLRKAVDAAETAEGMATVLGSAAAMQQAGAE